VWSAFETLRRQFNLLASWVNLLADPLGTIRGGVFLGTVKRYVSQVWALLVTLGVQRDPAPETSALRVKFPPKDHARIHDELRSGAYSDSPAVTRSLALLRERGAA
jgi:hypothetical protein